MNIIVNGRDHKWTNPQKRIGYSFLVLLAGLYPEHTPSVTYQLPSGLRGELLPGKFVAIEEGGRYGVYHTGKA